MVHRMLGRLALMAGLLVVAQPAAAQMSLPGKFEVTDTGSASYTIPIQVVPGTAGLEPKLSFQYDSRSGNGLLGVGWSLSGLPSVTRCGRTIAQDGQAGGVSYDANDRFCLDGQRLVAISGTYGADQTEYRTERESFSKIISYGSAGSGPAWFKVWTKAGLVMEFGNTADSRIEAQGKSSVRVWAINRTSDTKSNYFTVSYTEDNANGEYRPDRIDYTGNTAASIAPANSVRFVYEARPDIVPLYQAGSLIKTTKRMSKVQVRQGEKLVREYRIAYQITAVSPYTRVTGIELCGEGTDCLPSSQIDWESDNPFTFGSPVSWSSGPGWGSGYNITFADFNGDGRQDMAMYQMTSGPWYNLIALARADGTFESPVDWYGPAQGSGYSLGYPDINGDGLADAIAYRVSSGVWSAVVALGKGDGRFNAPVSWSSGPGWGGGYSISFADFNGDGRTDMAMHQMTTGPWYNLVALARVDGTFESPIDWYGPAQGSGYSLAYADVTGDGLADAIAYRVTGGVWSSVVAPGRGDGRFNAPIAWSSGPGWGPGYSISFGDFNADGAQDMIMYQSSNGWWYANVALARGDGTFASPVNWSSGPGWGSGYSISFADFNGDGRLDMVMHQMTSGPWYVFVAPGRGDGSFGSLVSWYGPAQGSGYNLGFVDVRGTGRADAIAFRISGGYWTARVAPVAAPSALTKSVGSGSGVSTQIAYVPLSQPASSYNKDTGVSACAYPCVDVQGPLYVVSEVRSSNGLGGEYRSTYRYAGAKSDQHGRGFLGFRQMVVKDEQTGVEQVTTYRQDYPLTGLVASREKKLGTTLLNRSINTYSSTNLGGTRRFPFLTLSVEESWELNSSALPSVTTGYQYDAFGNATQVSVSTGDGHTKVTTNTYQNDEANWHLGRLTRSEVTSTTPGQ